MPEKEEEVIVRDALWWSRKICSSQVLIPVCWGLFALSWLLLLCVSCPLWVKCMAILLIVGTFWTVWVTCQLMWVAYRSVKQNNKQQYQVQTRAVLHRWTGAQTVNWLRYDATVQPCIFLVNHLVASILDAAGLPLLNQDRVKIVTVIRGSTILPFRPVLDMCGHIFIQHGGGFEHFMSETTQALKDGYHILSYPEGKFSRCKIHYAEWRYLHELQTGIFELARRTRTPIVPVVFSGDSERYGFLPYCANPQLTLHYCDKIDPMSFASTLDLKNYTRHVMNEALACI